MVLTNERAEILANYLKENVERSKELADLSPEEAVKSINADGFDFTADEVKEFGDNLKMAVLHADELGEENLDEVSGGLVAAAAGVYLTCVSIGVTLGICAGSNWKW